MANNNVQFAYVSTGSSMPTYPDLDTVYFLEEAKEIRVGNKLFANVGDGGIDMSTLMEVLEAWTVKSVEITGQGDNISDLSFNSSTGKLTATKSYLPSLSKGTSPEPATTPLDVGGTFTVLVDTSVNGHTITDGKAKFKLPKQINSFEVVEDHGTIKFKITYSDGSTQLIASGLGSAALADSDDFVSNEGGVIEDATLNNPTISGGTLSGVTITDSYVTLAVDPTSPMDAATKQYVDNAVQGAVSNLNFLGSSSTPITAGGTEAPTIEGIVIPIATLNKGDWVIYNDTQYIWDGDAWAIYGNKGDVPKERKISAGAGLTGGGTLEADRTISHAAAGATSTTVSGSSLEVIDSVAYDQFGHVTSVDTRDIASDVGALITPVSDAVAALEDNLTDNYYTSLQTDEAISAAIANVSGIVDDEIEDKVATSQEFEEMMEEVFPDD